MVDVPHPYNEGPYKDKVSVSCTSFPIGIEEASVCVGGQKCIALSIRRK